MERPHFPTNIDSQIVISDLTDKQVNGVLRSYNDLALGLPDRVSLKHLRLDQIMPGVVKRAQFIDRENIVIPGFEWLLGAVHRAVKKTIDEISNTYDLSRTAIHVATPEGLLGRTATAQLRARKWDFSTAYHTQLPEYLYNRGKVPKDLTYDWCRRGHVGSQAILNRSEGMIDLLVENGFPEASLKMWRGGVNGDVFNFLEMDDKQRRVFLETAGVHDFDQEKEVLLLFVGRVSPEKNPQKLLDLQDAHFTDGRMARLVFLGDGVSFEKLTKRSRDLKNVHFLGNQSKEKVAKFMQAADVFVFPSNTDTLGLVLLESLCSKTPLVASAQNSFGVNTIDQALRSYGLETEAMVTANDDYLTKINWLLKKASQQNIDKTSDLLRQHYSLAASAAEFMSHQVPAMPLASQSE